MILDAYDTVYIWMGRESNIFEKKKSLEVGEFYIKMCVNNGRENSLNLIEVIEGAESQLFKSFFPDWDDDNLKKESDKLKEMAKRKVKKIEETKSTPGGSSYFGFPESEFEGYQHPRDHQYSKEEINKRPDYIKRNRCELYLSDAEFEKIFKMTKEKFYQEKDWKRMRYKKENDLW